jgi:hypothetical protein
MGKVTTGVVILVLGAIVFVGGVSAKRTLHVIEDPEGGVNEAYLSFDATGAVRHNPLTGAYTVKLGDFRSATR